MYVQLLYMTIESTSIQRVGYKLLYSMYSGTLQF